MKSIVIIPARYDSVRFPGKVLADLLGEPLIKHTYKNSYSKFIKDVIIATDDKRVERVCRSFKANVLMTSKKHKTGTERVAEVAKKINLDFDIVVNVQADEPLINSMMIEDLIKGFKKNISVATLKKKIQDKSQIKSSNVVKVVTDNQDCALYFSRAAIPCIRDKKSDKQNIYYKHLGIYAYTKDFLVNKFPLLKESYLADCEKLEQLKILENGYKIKVLETSYDTIGVDTLEDLKKVKKIIQKLNQ